MRSWKSGGLKQVGVALHSAPDVHRPAHRDAEMVKFRQTPGMVMIVSTAEVWCSEDCRQSDQAIA